MDLERIQSMVPVATVYTDGSCNEYRAGGWAAIILVDKRQRRRKRESTDEIVLTGNELNTTNNRMELTAVINAIEKLPTTHKVIINTDSEYVILGASKADYWASKGWKTAQGEPVKNQDLWERFIKAANKHFIKTNWVKGHAGNELNERCDELAKNARDELKDQYTQTKPDYRSYFDFYHNKKSKYRAPKHVVF